MDTNQTPPWEVKEGADGMGETLRHHIFLTATKAGMTTGLTVTTTHRTYYLTCKSVGKSPIRTVRWRYQPDPAAAPKHPKEPGLLPDPQEPRQYHIGYELVGSKPPPHWQPRQVVDDGKKTYIIYPEIALFETVPMLRLIGPQGPQLVNSRQFLNVVILDQLLGRGELRVGLGEHAETVTITRGELKTIRCPGDQRCPTWPQAAQRLAARGAAVQLPPSPASVATKPPEPPPVTTKPPEGPPTPPQPRPTPPWQAEQQEDHTE